MRVITEGNIQAGDQIVKTRTGPGALSVAGGSRYAGIVVT